MEFTAQHCRRVWWFVSGVQAGQRTGQLGFQAILGYTIDVRTENFSDINWRGLIFMSKDKGRKEVKKPKKIKT